MTEQRCSIFKFVVLEQFNSIKILNEVLEFVKDIKDEIKVINVFIHEFLGS